MNRTLAFTLVAGTWLSACWSPVATTLDAGASLDAGCPETRAELCAALGLSCGIGRGFDACGEVQTIDCGPCGARPVCGPQAPADCEHVCGADGLCWLFPAPMPSWFVTGTSATDLWAGGQLGAILHWNGTDWRQAQLDLGETVDRAVALAPNDVWALSFLHGVSIHHWDGTAWAKEPGADWSGLYAIGKDLWAAQGTTLKRRDGATWVDVPLQLSATQRMPVTMWGTSSTDAWAASGALDTWHLSGTTWSPPTRPGPSFGSSFFGLAGTSANDVWLGRLESFYRWDGTGWSAQPRPSTEVVYDLRAVGGDLWLLAGSELWHRQGNQWALAMASPARYGARLWTDGKVFWIARVGLARWDGKVLTPFVQPSPANERRELVSASGSWNDMWAVAQKSSALPFQPLPAGNPNWVLRWDGTRWNTAWTSSGTDSLAAVHGTDGNNVWAVGSVGLTLHWDGASWTRIVLPGAPDLAAVLAFGNTNI